MTEAKMQNLAESYEQTVKEVITKLDNMIWKLDDFEKNIINAMNSSTLAIPVSTGELMQELSNMRQNYVRLQKEVLEVETMWNTVQGHVNDEANSLSNEFHALQGAFKSLKL